MVHRQILKVWVVEEELVAADDTQDIVSTQDMQRARLLRPVSLQVQLCKVVDTMQADNLDNGKREDNGYMT